MTEVLFSVVIVALLALNGLQLVQRSRTDERHRSDIQALLAAAMKSVGTPYYPPVPVEPELPVVQPRIYSDDGLDTYPELTSA